MSVGWLFVSLPLVLAAIFSVAAGVFVLAAICLGDSFSTRNIRSNIVYALFLIGLGSGFGYVAMLLVSSETVHGWLP